MMNIFAPIEKLINEHGSSTILRERIALAQDQYTALEKKVKSLELQIEELKSKLENKENEIAELRDSGQCTERIDRKPPENERFDEKTESILLFLADNKDSHINTICDSLKETKTSINHRLRVLENKKLAHYYFRHETWSVSSEGHDYLFKHNLVMLTLPQPQVSMVANNAPMNLTFDD